MTTPDQTAPQSEFSYVQPEAAASDNLDAIARDTIAEIEAEFQADQAKQFADDDKPDKAEAEAEAEADPPDAPEAVAEEPAEEQDDPKLSRALERTVQRELKAKEAETRAETRLAELKAKEAEFTSLRGLKSTKDLMELASIDAAGVIKALGQDPDTFIRVALSQLLPPDRVPAELREFTKDVATKREIAALRRQIEEQNQARTYQEFLNSVQSGARRYVESVGDSTPTLAVVAKADPERVYREIMEEISRDAGARASQDPNGEPLPYAEAAKRVEERFAQYRALLLGPNGTTTATSQGTKKPAANSLPPQSKPPAKPLRAWEQKNDLEDRGLQDALREFHRMESAAKLKR
jgi:antitoxin component of RelBE/YafQ-DinJ toxin-antitoxin module